MPLAVLLSVRLNEALVPITTLLAGNGLPKEVFAVNVAPLLMMKLPGVDAVPVAVVTFTVPPATKVVPLSKYAPEKVWVPAPTLVNERAPAEFWIVPLKVP